jgi:hypothetical protein
MSVNLQHVVLFHHFRGLLEEAAREGLDVAPLKGAHLIASVYPEGEDRGKLSDVDFLVRPEDWERACALLSRMGFVRVPWSRGRLVSERTFYEAGFTLDVGDGRCILFEPHRRLIQHARHPIDHAALWRRSRPSTFEGAPCRRLSDDDHFLYGVVHLMTHQFVSPHQGLRDLELLLRFGAVDLEVVARRALEWECARATWLALTVLRGRCAGLVPDRILSALAPPPVPRRALRFLVPGEGGFLFPDLGDRAREAVLWPWLLDGPRPVLRFGAAYLRLRLRDLAAACRARS